MGRKNIKNKCIGEIFLQHPYEDSLHWAVNLKMLL